MIILRKKLFSKKEVREKVDKETADKARKEGVIQKKPNGKWGIISFKTNPPEWWSANYETKESADDALAAFHANKH